MNNRQRMYLDYKRELCAMDGVGLRATEAEYLQDIFVSETRPDLAEWIPIFHGPDEVGFLIVTHGKLLKRGEDYRIEEAYIKPEFRKRGLMTETVRKYLATHPGKYSMQVMVNNPAAARFWFRLIGKRFLPNAILHTPGDEVETIDLMFMI